MVYNVFLPEDELVIFHLSPRVGDPGVMILGPVMGWRGVWGGGRWQGRPRGNTGVWCNELHDLFKK